MTNSELKELTRRAISRTGRAEDSRRTRLILLLAEGHTWDEVSERIDCSRGFVASWSRRFTEQLPLKYFGANAAWLRLAVISYNVLTALKRLALPAELLSARPKRLRFVIFHTAGRLVHHARQLRLRLAMAIEEIAGFLDAVRLLPLPT